MNKYIPNTHNIEGTDFPVLYEDNRILVFENGSGEIFIEEKVSRQTLRITPDFPTLKITSATSYLIPSIYNSCPCIGMIKK
jgi:hypothetical protein